MKKILLLFTVFIVIAIALFLIKNYLKTGKNISLFKAVPTVTINTKVFKVIIANTDKDREIGLSKTTSMSENQGMIFLFKESNYYPFWTKNMKFAIDMIYINNDTITNINENAKPPKGDENPSIYTPTKPANKVFEIKAGLSKKYNFKVGDKVTYENFSN